MNEITVFKSFPAMGWLTCKYLKANPNNLCFFEQEGYKQHHPYQVLVYQSKDEGRGVPGQEEGPSVDDDSQGSSCTWKISLIEKCKN